MKEVIINKNTRSLLLLAACLASALSAHADGKVISINVNNTPAMAATDVAGADYRVANWNNLAPSKFYQASNSGQTWTYNDGSSIDGSFIVISSQGHPTGNGSGTGDAALFSSSTELQSNTPLTFTLNNIPFAEYKIYVYAGRADSWGDWGGSISTGSQTYYVTDNGTSLPTDSTGYDRATTTSLTTPGSSAGIDPGNYVLFESLSGGSQTITITALNFGTASPNEYRLNVYGIQIVEVISSTPGVPEPANVAILVGLIGLAGAISFRRITRNRLS